MSTRTLSHNVLRNQNRLLSLINSNVFIGIITSQLPQSLNYPHLLSELTPDNPQSVIKFRIRILQTHQ